MKDLVHTSISETRPAYLCRKSHLYYTATTPKLEEVQQIFCNMYKPFLALQMAQYLAHEPLCSAY